MLHAHAVTMLAAIVCRAKEVSVQTGFHLAVGRLRSLNGRGAGVIGRERSIVVVAYARCQENTEDIAQRRGVGRDSSVWVESACSTPY